jgi:Neuraminidase (sialidase)
MSVPFVAGVGGYTAYRIPALTVAPDGSLLAFAEGRRNSVGDSGEIDIVCRRSGDGGATWADADFLSETNDLWAWRLWQAQIEVHLGTSHIIARAKDTAGNSQPRDTQEIWNFKGYANNAWHKVQVLIT